MIRIQVRGIDRVYRTFETAEDRLRSLGPVNAAIAIELKKFVDENFDSDGKRRQPEGWVPWAESTRKARERKNRRLEAKAGQGSANPPRLLQDTRALRQSFLEFYDDHEAGVGALSTREHADLAEIHEFGSAARNIPARPMLPSPEQALEIGMRVYGLYMEQVVKP